MPVVDHERAWVRLKEELLKKPAHGQKDLLQVMSKIEIECLIPEGEEGFDARPLPPAQRSSRASDERPRAVASRA